MTLTWMPEPMRLLVEQATEPQRVAACLFGEARSEPVQGIIAVANVIRNRTLKPTRFGATFSDVVTAPKQFSCWAPDGGERNYQRMLSLMQDFAAGTTITDGGARECIGIAHLILGNYLRDNTKGSLHYHTATLTPRPRWARQHVPVVQVGHHSFYSDVA
jgi:N-acetylmuramoyl-L-alanine amidase